MILVPDVAICLATDVADLPHTVRGYTTRTCRFVIILIIIKICYSFTYLQQMLSISFAPSRKACLVLAIAALSLISFHLPAFLIKNLPGGSMLFILFIIFSAYKGFLCFGA